MIGLLQRVTHARVEVDEKCIGRIGRGLMVLVGVEKADGAPDVKRLCERLLGYRVFPDEQGRMNLSVADTAGGVLLVPQFTLAANTRKGTRASLASAATPETGQSLFGQLVSEMRSQHDLVECGEFGANMQVTLCNDGPVTFWIET